MSEGRRQSLIPSYLASTYISTQTTGRVSIHERRHNASFEEKRMGGRGRDQMGVRVGMGMRQPQAL